MGVLLLIPIVIIIIIIIRNLTTQSDAITCNRCFKTGSRFIGSGWKGDGRGKVSQYRCNHCGNIIERK